ncbi:alternative NAD(P)H-ubiquinone oxidoreductase C1, chloroplastic/mitochondrial isoform X2 [Zea mays]|uniref:demethylphylloquinone reductase n=1 Tax=Zea mays TaxID=4577 RepID=A0A804R1U7_MAIZE|nr:uncharacterized protein LOC100282489 isoform X2 [Zea mays]
MSCRAAPWSRPSHIAGPRVPTPARPRFALGSRNLWKNSWTIGAGVSNMFALPSTLFRCMASSGSGDGDFARSTLTDEAAPFPLYSWPDKQRPRVCILGGGFGGLYTALRLESLVWPNDKRPQVLLVDQSDKFVFKPMLYELLSGEVDIWEIAPSFTELLKNTSVQFVRDSVKLLRPSDHLRRKPGEPCTGGVVHLESGTVIEYDWLVLALGAEAKIDVVPGSAEYALPFTTLEDALRVESKLKMLERKRFGKSSPTIEVAIVGLGYSGVELAATISERLKNTGTVKAINVQTTVCPTAPQGNRDAALKVLESRNIQLFLGYFVSCIKEAPTSDESSSTVTYSEVDGDHRKLILDLQPAERGLKGQTLDADLVLWTVGSTSQIPRLQPPDAPYVIPLNGRGQVETEETLQVKGHPRTFAIGDSAALRDPSGKLLPATAQVAFQQADFAGWNLWAAINDRPLLPFRFQNLGEMMTLGRNDAAVTASFIEGLTLEGPLGHAARKLVYCLRMPTDEHRVKVGISWFTKAAIDSLASVQNAAAAAIFIYLHEAPPAEIRSPRCVALLGSQLVSSPNPNGRLHRHQPLLADRSHGSRLRGRLRLPALPLPVQERPHPPPRRRPHRPSWHGPSHRRRVQGHPRRPRLRASLPPSRRSRQDPGGRLLPRRRVRGRLAGAAGHAQLPQRPGRPLGRHRRVRLLPPRAGAQAARGVRRRVGGATVGGDARRRRGPVAAGARRPVPRVPGGLQRRRQHRAQHGRAGLRRRRAPRRRDHPRARRGAPLLHGQRGRGRRDSLRPRDPAVHGPHLAVRGLRHGGAGRPAREPVRGRRGAQGLRGDPVPARAGVRGRERLPAQGARAVVPPGDQGQRVRWRGRAVRV